MRTPSRLALLAFLALSTAHAHAAGFDCRKAVSAVEKQVCADPALSKLDQTLAEEYAYALKRAGDATALRASQLAWLKSRNACTGGACLQRKYKVRIDELRAIGQPVVNASVGIQAACASLAAEADAHAADCVVTESGSYGSVDGLDQVYATYCLDARGEDRATCDLAALALFTLNPRTGQAERWLQRVDAEAQGNRYERPELLQVRDGLLLHLPVAVPGTGGFNASELFRRVDGRWVEVDNTTWVGELAGHLPKGLAAWKGIWPDYQRMHASTGLYRPKDANCCATGGTAEIELALQGERIVIVDFKITPPSP